MYHPGHGVHGSEPFPPPRGAHREQQGYARGKREHARRGPNHGKYGFWDHGRSFGRQRFDGLRFPPHGGHQPQRKNELVDVSNPTFVQMAQHWYNTCFTNPSVGAFAHSSSCY